MKLPRFIHRIYADLFGYFWLPCPICGRDFGGHEIGDVSLMHSPHEGRLVCCNCGKEARRLNQKGGRWIE